MSSQNESDEFEVVESLDVAREIVKDRRPDLQSIIAWLKPTDYNAPSSEYKRHLSSQAPQTGEWIRETAQFRQWYRSSSQGAIWIKAVPGAGKSVIAATTIDSLIHNESAVVLFFLFRQIVETNRTFRALIRDWMAQLLPSNELLQVTLWDLVEDRKGLEAVSTDQLWGFLITALRTVKKVYCIVDALDEMDVDEDFLARLNTLGSFRPAHVKLLMTSRPHQYLQRKLRDPEVIHIDLDEELIRKDIMTFANHRVTQFDWSDFSPDIQQAIVRGICARANGLFLYARLMLDQLCELLLTQELTETSIYEALVKMPTGLEHAYNFTLSRHATIAGVDEEVQLCILKFVTHSARPLRLIELATVLDSTFNLIQTKVNAKEIVRKACGPLIEILQDETVQILHHSLTEFLLNKERAECKSIDSYQFPAVHSLTTHREMAITCLNYLQSGMFASYPVEEMRIKREERFFAMFGRRDRSDFDFRPISLQFPLTEYTAWYWTHHVREYNTEDLEVFNLVQNFCDPNSGHFHAWLDLLSTNSPPLLARANTSLLHMGASFGLDAFVKFLISRGTNLDIRDGFDATPLQWAAQNNHRNVVKLLLTAGANPDTEDENGQRPLHDAAIGNHVDIVELLLAAGVSPTMFKPAEDAYRYTAKSPLSEACERGHIQTVLKMIPYLEAKHLDQALCHAASHGHSELLTAILNNSDASPNAIESLVPQCQEIEVGETALMYAVMSRDIKCVQVLLERGAEVNKVSTQIFVGHESGNTPINGEHQTRKEHTALHKLALVSDQYLAESTLEEIMDLLLKAGANIEARDGAGNTPLLLTVGKYELETRKMDMFLAAGADTQAVDLNGESILHKCCTTLHTTEAASKILKFGADPNQKRSLDGATPVHCATENYNEPEGFLRLLAQHGANINAVDFDGNTPIMWTCRNMHPIREPRAMKTLLDLSADLNVQNYHGQTCLHLLLQHLRGQNFENDDLVLKIIDAGANLELCDRNGMTPLFYAVSEGMNIAKVLLQQSRRPSITGRTHLTGKTILHLACHTQHPESTLNSLFGLGGDPLQTAHARHSVSIVELLISLGADPLWKDYAGNSLLHEVAAVFDGTAEQIALVTKLIDLGIDAGTRNHRGQTAIHILSHAADERTVFHAPRQRRCLISVLQQLKCRIDVNSQDFQGYSPLHYAAASSEVQTFNLLHHGANINTKAHNLRTPLHCAARGRQCNIIAMLLRFARDHNQKLNINARDSDGISPLSDACRSGRPESVKILINSGANVNAKDARGCTPLMACADFEAENHIWQALSSENADLHDDFRNTSGERLGALFGSVNHSRHKGLSVAVIAKMLIRAGSVTDKAVEAGVIAGNAELVAAIRQSEDEWTTDKVQSFSESLLLYPLRNWTHVLENSRGSNPVENPIEFIDKLNEWNMDVLLEKGVDFSRGEGRTAMGDFVIQGMTELVRKSLHQARFFNDDGFLQRLAKSLKFGCTDPLLHLACRRPLWNMDMVRLLVIEGASNVNGRSVLNGEDNSQSEVNKFLGPTALHILARGEFSWQIDAIQFLIENGALIDAIDEDGCTALHLASTYDTYGTRPCAFNEQGSYVTKGLFKPQCCELLLRLGANPNALDSQGLTPLNKADTDQDIIKILLKYGADVNVGKRGALMSAVAAGDIAMMKFYLEHGADPNKPDSSGRRELDHDSVMRYPLLAAAFPGEIFWGCQCCSQPSKYEWDRPTSTEMSKLLLAYGAKYDLHLEDGSTIIHHLFQHAPSSVLESFLETPLNVNAKDSNGRTVFMAACQSTITFEDDDIRLLKSKHTYAKPWTQKDTVKYTFGPPELVTKLKAEYVPAYLKLANSDNYGSAIDYLSLDDQKKHFIMYLLHEWTPKVAKRFLGIPGLRELVLQKDNSGCSTLHHALQHGMVDAAICLVDICGADILEPDVVGNTILHYLCRDVKFEEMNKGGRRLLAEKFLTAGGSINARNDSGETPFHVYIATVGGLDGVFSLRYHRHRDSRASWSASDEKEKATSRTLSRTNSSSSAQRPFSDAGSDDQKDVGSFTDFNILTNLKVPPPFPFFSANNADFCAAKYNGETALHIIAQRPLNDGQIRCYGGDERSNNAMLFETLVDLGCDLLQEDENGRTALDVATAMGNDLILELYQREERRS